MKQKTPKQIKRAPLPPRRLSEEERKALFKRFDQRVGTVSNDDRLAQRGFDLQYGFRNRPAK